MIYFEIVTLQEYHLQLSRSRLHLSINLLNASNNWNHLYNSTSRKSKTQILMNPSTLTLITQRAILKHTNQRSYLRRWLISLFRKIYESFDLFCCSFDIGTQIKVKRDKDRLLVLLYFSHRRERKQKISQFLPWYENSMV